MRIETVINAPRDLRCMPSTTRSGCTPPSATSPDEHDGRGEAIRQARLDRIAYRRNTTLKRPSDHEPPAAAYFRHVLAH